MGLTRPTVAQLNTVVTEISDPISVLNKGSTLANVDVGFVFNRDSGASPNVAVYWNETTDSLVIAYTTSTGGVNSNIAVSSYANLTVGNITSSGNISSQYFVGSGQYLTGLPAGYSNVNVKAYTETMGFQNYGNVNVAAYTQTQSYTNYSNVNLAAYLGGAVTIGGNLTINGNLFVNGNVVTINANNLVINDSMIYLADDNPSDVIDIGFVSSFTNPGYQHTGFVRDASDGVWKLFANVIPEPTTTVDFTNANYSSLYVGNIQTAASANIGSTLNVVGNVLGSIGTFSALTVGGFINTIGNVSTAALTAGQINTTGNVLASTVLSSFLTASTAAVGNISAVTIGNVGATLTGTTFNAGNIFVNTTGNIIVNNTRSSTSNVTGAVVVAGGIGVGGNLYVGQRVGFVWGANNVSSVYQVFNNSTNSLDTVFG